MPNRDSRPIVLIVEDEALVRHIASEEFADAGYEVIEAADGAGAVSVLSSDRRIDLLFTDIRLPGPIDGWSIADRARSLRPEIPVIYATGYTSEQMRTVEGALFFRKPYRPAELIAAADRLRTSGQA